METCKKNLLFIYLGVLMFLFSQVSHVSSATDTISTNQPLSGSNTIVSSGDIFELGLFNPGRYENFYIGMWYKQISPRTIVWVTNRDSPPLQDNSNSILKISDGNLILYDNITATVLWSTGVNTSRSKDVQAVLLDNGNLQLRDGPTSYAAVLWQSFDHPSDTWLPGAKLGSQRFTSWNDLKDPSPGKYALQVDPNITHSLIAVWNVYFSQPENRCEIYDYCGAFGICNDNQEPQPCSCVPGFKPERQGWDSDDFFGTCIMETELQCGMGNDEFLPIKNMKLATDPTTILVLRESLVTTCASRCLTNCSCKAYAYDGNKCLMWASDAFNLQQLDANQGHTFFLRRAASNFSIATSNKGKTKHSKGRRIVLLVVLSSLVAAAAFFVALYCYISPRRRRNRTQRDEKQSRELLEGGVIDDDGEHMCYLNLHNIMAATNAFSEENKLGEGGFGPVYKGKLTNGMDVAIKRLSKKSSQGTMKQRNIFSILCSIFVSFGVASVSAQQCMNNGNFRPNSTYDENRSHILSSLPSNVKAQDGFFYSGSIGKEPNRVYAIGMCIPGSAPDDCYVCIDTAFKGLIKSCPKQTEAYSWPGDPTLCLVRYSNSSFSGYADLDPQILETNNTGDITSNLTEFKTIWEDLTGRMIAEASAARSTPSSSSNHYTANVAALTKFQNIYALMQCTPDISPGDCEKCLKQSVMVYQSCCGQKQGGVVLQPSCYFKWESFAFSKAFDNITVASPPVTVPKPTGNQANTTNNDSKGISAGVVVAITVPTVVTVLILLVLGFFLCRRRKSYKKVELNQNQIQSRELLEGGVIDGEHICYLNLHDIMEATNAFSEENKLGEGGFGPVYKGKLPNGMDVAIKRLSKKSSQGLTEFKNEVVLIIKLQHKNLVRLLGYCVEGDEKLLIYEYMSNKSLDGLLFDSLKSRELDWETRMKIVNGTTRGLQYLHEDSRLRIIHRDIKASNILLDDEMNPKISDFGTARIFGCKQIDDSTKKIVGTIGYMSPEYALGGMISEKSDIYSFGVLLLEIISGKKATTRFVHNDQEHSLTAYAWESWCETKGVSIIDEALCGSYALKEVMRCIHIALLCVQDHPKDRPTTSQIVYMLSNDNDLPIPKQPTFSNVLNGGQQLASSDYVFSINEATQTELEAR